MYPTTSGLCQCLRPGSRASNRSAKPIWTWERANRTLALSTASTGGYLCAGRAPDRIDPLFDDACPDCRNAGYRDDRTVTRATPPRQPRHRSHGWPARILRICALSALRMPLRTSDHQWPHDMPRWSVVSSAVRKGRFQAASLAPPERPLSALDPVNP